MADRSTHRTLSVRKRVLDMGFRSIALSAVCTVMIYQPPRITLAKLIFATIAIMAGALVAALISLKVSSIAVGAGVGFVLGLVPFIPKPPTSLMISGNDGGAAFFQSNDVAFLKRVKGFIDARLNQDDMTMTGRFDFESSRFEVLEEEGAYRGFSAADVAETADELTASDLRQDQVPPLNGSSSYDRDETYESAGYEETEFRDDGSPDLDVSAPPHQTASAAAPHMQVDEERFSALADELDDGLPAADDVHADGEMNGTHTLPPIDFTHYMPQIEHVRRFYDETLQDADAVDQLDTMIVLMEEGAPTQEARETIRGIARDMQDQLGAYPRISSIFNGIVGRLSR